MTPPLQKGCSCWGRTTDTLVLRTPSPHGIRPAPRTRRSPLCNRAPADHTRASLGQHVPWPVSPRTVKGPLVSSSRGDWPGLFRGRRRRRRSGLPLPKFRTPSARRPLQSKHGGRRGSRARRGRSRRRLPRGTEAHCAGPGWRRAPGRSPRAARGRPAAGTAAALCPQVFFPRKPAAPGGGGWPRCRDRPPPGFVRTQGFS